MLLIFMTVFQSGSQALLRSVLEYTLLTSNQLAFGQRCAGFSTLSLIYPTDLLPMYVCNRAPSIYAHNIPLQGLVFSSRGSPGSRVTSPPHADSIRALSVRPTWLLVLVCPRPHRRAGPPEASLPQLRPSIVRLLSPGLRDKPFPVCVCVCSGTCILCERLSACSGTVC